MDKLESPAEAEALIDSLLPFARKMLVKHRAFYPYGGHTALNGSIVMEGAYDGDERPLSKDLIDLLNDTHRHLAAKGEMGGCALVYDILTVPPGRSKKQDAICIAIDLPDGYSALYIFPYRFTLFGRLEVEEGFIRLGNASIFPVMAS